MVSFSAGSYVEDAYAKVNLHLQVGPRRADGYHDIVSLFQLIDLKDTLTISIAHADELSITCDAAEGIDPTMNTMIHAASLFAAETGLCAAIHLSCEKRIPVQAGLGGGSSDGAAVLRLLNRVCGSPMERERLVFLGAVVGSDVPFFLGPSPASFVRGRGELVASLTPRSDLAGFVVMPAGSRVSTARAFADLDALRVRIKWAYAPSDETSIARSFACATSQWTFSNDFRSVMGELESIYDALDELVVRTGGCFGTVSGSGSAYCIVTESQEIIERLHADLLLFPHELCLYPIKCLHRGHSGDTVSL